MKSHTHAHKLEILRLNFLNYSLAFYSFCVSSFGLLLSALELDRILEIILVHCFII